MADSGKYSCSPSNADVASVRVHVLNGRLAFIWVSFLIFFLSNKCNLLVGCDGLVGIWFGLVYVCELY